VWDAYTAEFVKDWVCEAESDEIYPSYFAEIQCQPSDIAKALSKLLNKRPSISRQDIAELPKLSCKLVKRTLSQIFTMKKFS
jgi:protein-arginine kinase activator protein McsA